MRTVIWSIIWFVVVLKRVGWLVIEIHVFFTLLLFHNSVHLKLRWRRLDDSILESESTSGHSFDFKDRFDPFGPFILFAFWAALISAWRRLHRLSVTCLPFFSVIKSVLFLLQQVLIGRLRDIHRHRFLLRRSMGLTLQKRLRDDRLMLDTFKVLFRLHHKGV